MSQPSSLTEVVEKLRNTNNRAVAFVIRQPDQAYDAPSIMVAKNYEDIQYDILMLKHEIDVSAGNALEIIALDTNGKQIGDQGRIFLDQGKLCVTWDCPEKMDPDTNISNIEFPFSKEILTEMLHADRLKAADHFLDTLSIPDGPSVKSSNESIWKMMKSDFMIRDVIVQRPDANSKDMVVILDFKPGSSEIKRVTLDDRPNQMSWNLDIPEPEQSNDNSMDDGPDF